MEIDQWLGNLRVVYISKDDRYYEELDAQKSAEELWDEGKLEWQTCTPTVNQKHLFRIYIQKRGERGQRAQKTDPGDGKPRRLNRAN